MNTSLLEAAEDGWILDMKNRYNEYAKDCRVNKKVVPMKFTKWLKWKQAR